MLKKMLAAASVFLFPLLVHAQFYGCGQLVVSGSIQCFSTNCEDSVPDDYLDQCIDGFDCPRNQAVAYNCCGRIIYYSEPSGYCWLGGALRDRRTAKDLLALSKTANVLVTDCRGSFVPFEVALEFAQTHPPLSSARMSGKDPLLLKNTLWEVH